MKIMNMIMLLAAITLTARAAAIPESPYCKDKDSGLSLVSSSGTPFVEFTNPLKPGELQTFRIAVDIHCDANHRPAGEVTLTDFPADGAAGYSRIAAITFPMLNLTRGTYPAAYVSGPCTTGSIPDCRYWLMLTDKTVGFSISRLNGERLFAGAGRIVAASGEIKVAAPAE